MESPDMPTPTLVPRDHIFFDFTLKIKEELNATMHTIPYTLKIKLNDGTLLPKEAYQILSTDFNRQSATVTINVSYITDNFTITGEATEINYFEWDILVCGADLEGDTDKDGYLHGASRQENGATFCISGEKVNEIDFDRIIIEDLNGNIYRKTDGDCPDFFKSFDITKEANKIDLKTGENITYDYVAIYVSVPNYEFFSKLSWTTINKFNEKNWDNTFFNVGDTKKVTVADVTYDARIIGFDHDNLTSKNGKASMTIEFAQVITMNNGDAYLERFDERIGEDYRETIYDNYLQSVFLPLFPSDLQSCVKEVDKPVATWDGRQTRKMQHLYTKIFPISVKELNLEHAFYWDNEGETYNYYKDCGPDKRIKKNCEVSGSANNVAVSYWTRSILQGDDYCQAYYVKESGDIGRKDVDKKIGYIVAFCI